MSTDAQLPQISRRFHRGFTRYVNWLLKRSFHCIRLANTRAADATVGHPTVVYANHASWWDPLACLFLGGRYFQGRNSYAPIDARALERYGLFRKLGFFGVEQNTAAGAKTFLGTSRRILEAGDHLLWLTPEGAMTDPRKRPVELKRGIGHLARYNTEIIFLPIATEFPFALERKAEICIRMGQPIPATDLPARDPAAATAQLATALTSTMDTLAGDVIARDTEAFDYAWSGSDSNTFFYSLWKRLKAFATGKPYERDHASVMKS